MESVLTEILSGSMKTSCKFKSFAIELVYGIVGFPLVYSGKIILTGDSKLCLFIYEKKTKNVEVFFLSPQHLL